MLRRIVLRLLFTAVFAVSLSAATFTVSNGNTFGPGSLAQAILDANANPGHDQIVFTVTGVSTDPELPPITDPVDIDGTVGTSRAQVGPSGTCFGCALFRFSTGSDGSTIRDLRLDEPSFYQVVVDAGVDGVSIAGILFIAQIRIAGTNSTLGGNTAADALISVGSSAIQFAGGSGHQLLGSTLNGTHVVVAAPNIIISNNTIAAGGPEPAIGVFGGSATGVAITGNNLTASGLAIDLGLDGSTPNDPAPDADTGANQLQNFPVLTAAYLTPGALTVTGTLTSAPLTPYQIELFANDASNPDARTFLGAFNVTTDASGNAAFAFNVASPLPAADEVITATATNRGSVAIAGNAPNSTSEVSAPVAVTEPGVLGLSAASYLVDENAGTVTITVLRTGGSEGTVTVDYATSNGTATAPADYTATSGMLTFGPGVTEQTFTIAITDDAAIEGNEAFTVTLADPTGGATLGTSTATVTITDDDVAAAAIPTASEWALLAMVLALALIGILRR